MGELSLAGFWTGKYWYDDPFEPSTAFFLNMEDEKGCLSGSVTERTPDDLPDEILTAFIRGKREGSSVEFAKVYDGAGPFAHRVDYVGLVNAPATIVEGEWRLEEHSGGFRMTRQISTVGENAIEQAEALAVE